MTAEPRKIVVVFKTHFDIGFTGLVDEVLDAYARVMFPQAVEACRAGARGDPALRSTWTVPAWPLVHCLEMLRGTRDGAGLEQAVTEGLVAWHALPFTLHTELFGLEDLIRAFSFGRMLRERFGRAAVSAKMTDVPGHTWILPTLLANAGVLFLHLGCNACSTPPDVPLLFHWEGPDGSRVITMYSRGGYGTPLFPPPGWTLPVWLSLRHTQDNEGPHSAEAVGSILAEVRSRFPGTEVVFGSLDDFARALAPLAPELPVVRKDLADTWIHGIASMPREVGMLRRVRNRLVQAESAESLRLLTAAGPEDGAAAAAAASAAYEKILLFGEHTWGMDTKLALNPKEFGGRVYEKGAFRRVLESGKYDRILRSWSDKAKLVAEAEERLSELESRLGAAAGGSTDMGDREVVNHHLWTWNGPLRIGAFDRPVRAAIDGDGSEVPVFQIGGETWADLRDIPPFSRVRLKLEERPVPARGDFKAKPVPGRARLRSTGDRVTLENGRLRVSVDRSGGRITSLVDLENAREWVDRKSRVPFGQYRYDVYSRREIVAFLKSYAYDLEPWFLDDFGKPGYPQGTHRTFTGDLVEAEEDSGDGWARLRLLWRQDRQSVQEFGNAGEVELKLLLLDGQPWLDMEYGILGKEACPLLEAAHVVMPLAARAPRYAINKTGCVIDPDADVARDANHLLHCCERWLDVGDGECGMLVIPVDSPLFSLGEPAIERFDGSARSGDPVLCFNLFNTQWGTNFPQWIDGSFTFRFRLIPHQGDWRHARAWEHAAAALQPPSCSPVNGIGAGQYILLAGPVRGLETVTLKRADRGDGLILRLREPTGRGGKRSLSFRAAALGPAPRLIRCSLLEDEQDEVPLRNRGQTLTAELSVRPFEVLTLKLKP